MREGTFFYTQESGDFEVYQILKIASDEYLVASYWPIYQEPQIQLISQLDLRTSCTALSLPLPSAAQVLGWKELSPDQQDQIDNFLKIRSSKQSRNQDFSMGYTQAQLLFEQGEFHACITTLTAIAPYNKLFVDTYRLRGLAYFSIGDTFNALYDLNHYLDQHPEPDPEILQVVRDIETKK